MLSGKLEPDSFVHPLGMIIESTDILHWDVTKYEIWVNTVDPASPRIVCVEADAQLANPLRITPPQT